MDPIGENPLTDHVGMVGSCRRFLMPGGIKILMQVTVDMSGHMPHMSNPRCGEAASFGRMDCQFCFIIIPEVDTVMMDRMKGINRQDVVE